MEDRVAKGYKRFAELEALGISDTYYDWAVGISNDPTVRTLIADLPGNKKQPNLVFAAARFVGAPLEPYSEFGKWLVDHWGEVAPVIMERSTQTNEAARCAVLLPLLSELRGPLALIEVGASAGLTLYPDRYSYRYRDDDSTTQFVHPASGPSRVEIPCVIDSASVPSALPEVAWRAGIDLNPLDVNNQEQLDWLEALIWPEHDERRERLREAAKIVANDPPLLVEGDLVDELPDLVAQAPQGANVVVFHSAVLNYLPESHRHRFVELIKSLDNVTWVSNEGAGVLPSVSSQISLDIQGRTILAHNGSPYALVGPHGQSFQRV
ncbi:DUF2332 domain-containing protein [Brevibacterium sp. CBA3109]|uniref:DUF2332 domain-containing protein n=1 Tax=Brevibacterium koreense TaxID=3140787 RepID=A0AAU7UN26_9MICO